MLQAVQDIKQAADEIAQDLAGFATQAAMQQLVQNWETAVSDGDKDFSKAVMVGDIDCVISNLKDLKVRLQEELDANLKMRCALGLPYVLPPFDGCDEQLAWLGRIRENYPHIDPKEAFRLAEQDYTENEGILPITQVISG